MSGDDSAAAQGRPGMRGGAVVMVGTALDTPGGMTAVVHAYREHGLFERWGVRYLESYRGAGAWRQLSTMAAVLMRLLGWLLRREVRLVHVHSASRGSFLRKSVVCAASWLFRVPYVFHLHSGEFPVYYGEECSALGRAWVRWVLRHAAAVVVLTPGWADTVQRIEPRARVRMLVNPVAVPAHPRPVAGDSALRVLFLGRLRQLKGVFDLVRALPAVLRAFPGTQLCLAGDGDIEGVRALARGLGVDAAVQTPGWIDGADKDRLLASADVLVLPSYFEGLPVCVLEAMAAGVPVLATQVGGIPFALGEGHCGVLVPPGQPDALSQAMCRLLGDTELRSQLARRAHQRALSVFSTDTVLRELEELWMQVLARRVSAGLRGESLQ